MPALQGRRPGRETRIANEVVLRTLLFTLAYEGTEYVGWQRQAASAGVSVQGLVEDAHARLAGHASVAGASAGVHITFKCVRFAGNVDR